MVGAILQGLHVFFGVLWFGGSMFSNFVVVPASNRIEADHANAFMMAYGKVVDKYMVVTATGTILLGIIVGFPLGAWSDLGNAYGNTYLISLIVAVLIWLFGALVLGRNVKKAMGYGIGTPEFVAILNQVKKYGALELLGFIVLFVLMVAMRFGY